MTDIAKNAMRETWESVYEKSLSLAYLIEEHCRTSGERFDAIVVVPRGSYYPVNIISRELGFDAGALLHACLTSYEDQKSERAGKFKIGQMPADKDVKDKNLFIVEEVCDTGYTLDFLVKRFKEQGANLVRSGVLYYKPARNETGFKPDLVVAETDEWIVYPWEKHELQGQSSIVRRK